MTGPWMYGVRHVAPYGDSTILVVVDSVDITGQAAAPATGVGNRRNRRAAGAGGFSGNCLWPATRASH